MVGVIDNESEMVEPPRRLLATLVDSLAIECPTRRFCLIPNGTEIHQGFREVTFNDLCRAVNTMSWWMAKHLGSSVEGETIAYLGSNDIRYIILMLASHKTGCTILFPSTRLSNEAYDSVFGATRTKMLLFSPEKHHIVSGLTEPSKSISSLEVPSVAEMLDDNSNVKRYSFTSTYEEMEDKTAFIIHSSGTTGRVDNYNYLPDLLMILLLSCRYAETCVSYPWLPRHCRLQRVHAPTGWPLTSLFPRPALGRSPSKRSCSVSYTILPYDGTCVVI
jgi:acyl-CoA synthetase (AMP-forming)/AMP-acid ligase II